MWGLWHAPLVLLGYNFNEPNLPGLIVMAVGCMSLGDTFGWLRLRSGNIWAAVLAHGTSNAAAGLALLLSAVLALVETLDGPTAAVPLAMQVEAHLSHEHGECCGRGS